MKIPEFSKFSESQGIEIFEFIWKYPILLETDCS